MSTIYIHAGTPKTGTSAIQVFCGKNRKLLKEKGICFPNLGFEFEGIGINRNGHFMNRRIIDDQKHRLRDQEKELVDKGMGKLEPLLQQYTAVLLSDEQFWNNKEMNANKWASYRERFASMGADLKVIVYLRRQDLLIQSYWAQQVKETMTISFKKYIESNKYKYFKLDYDKKLDEIAKGVGKENIIVRVYEKQQYYGGNILSDFLHIFGVEMTDDFRQADHVVNASLEGPCLEVKRLLNNSPVYGNKKSFLVPLLTQIQQEKVGEVGYTTAKYFSQEMHETFMGKFEEGNRKVAREYLGREDGVLFRDELVMAQDEEATRYSSKDLVLILGEVIARQQEMLEQMKKEAEEEAPVVLKPEGGMSAFVKKLFGRE